MKRSRMTLAAVSMLTLSTSVFAAPINVPNYSFEDDNVNTNSFLGNTTPSDWAFTATAGSSSPGLADGAFAGLFPGADEQDQYAFLRRSGYIESAASLGTVIASQEYTLTVALGDGAASVNRPAENYELSILVDGIVVATSGIIDGSAITDATWDDFSVSWTALVSGGDLTVRIAHSGTDDDRQGYVDNVRFDVVPEPGSLALLGLGVLMTARRRRSS